MKRALRLFHFLISPVAKFFQNNLDNFIANFGFESIESMKANSKEVTDLSEDKTATLLNIKFKEEQKAWAMPYKIAMPLFKIPSDYFSLGKSKKIVTTCPDKDRAVTAMMYLKSKGNTTGTLFDGLHGLAEYLKVDKPKLFIDKLE